MASASYKVYENEDNKAVYIGDVTAAGYEEEAMLHIVCLTVEVWME